MSDWLLPDWAERLARRPPRPTASWAPPLARPYLTGSPHFVQTLEQARRMVQATYELPLACAGIDTEYRYREAQPLELPTGKQWQNITTLRPFCLALALLTEGEVACFVVD